MWTWLQRIASPPHFYRLAGRLVPWLAVLTALLIAAGLVGGLGFSPADYQQGDAFRIIFVHVPSAWMSMFIYVVMAIAGAVFLVWNHKVADVLAGASAPIGASFTFLALVELKVGCRLRG